VPYAVNTLAGRRIHYEDGGGRGTPVLVHGGFLDPIELVRDAPIARALREHAADIRLVFVDHVGHGRSDKPHDAEAYAIDLRVADVMAVLDDLSLERAHHVGISWGGRLAFGIGARVPDRTRSLTVIGQQPYGMDPNGPMARVVGDALDRSRVDGIEALVEAFEAVVGRYPDRVRSAYLAADPAAMRAAFAMAMAEGAVATNLTGWRIPCVICAAEEDVDFFGPARRAASEIPNATFVAIRGEDHLGMDTARVDPLLPAVLEVIRADP
jgi:pimeloyl-ACP methyl ester carboxylesterase